jgi:hypothetical protein
MANATLYRDKKALQAANLAIGKLSNASKLPKKTRAGCNISTGSSFSTSAYDCRTGSKLRKIAGSVCSTCYACKGRQNFPKNQEAYRNRTALYFKLGADAWADNLCAAIEPDSDFRFFDSGDLADYAMLRAIVQVAARRPDVRFWLPTKEYADVQRLQTEGVAIPSNLCIRVSVPMLNQDIPNYGIRSVVFEDAAQVPDGASICPCSTGDRSTCDGTGAQVACRNCWDSNVQVVCYLKH